MKKLFILLSIIPLFLESCTDFLNISPDASIKEEEVFTKINNTQSYFNPVYSKIRNGNPLYFTRWDNKWGFEEVTEAADCGRILRCQEVKNGKIQNIVKQLISDKRPILHDGFKTIRICNNVIRNADRIEDAISEEDVYDLKAQAYFMRGYAYFQMCRLWGGMPYLYDILTSDDEWDRPRLSPADTYKAIAGDMDLAYENFVKANKVRRDPKPGEPGHLSTSYKLNLPNGCAALALKSRALLYAASPLNNKDNNPELWKEAAQASWEAIQIALENGYSLLPIEKWIDNTWNVKYTNEQLWADANGKIALGSLQSFLTGQMANNPNYAAGICPSQNFIDKYETAPIGNELGYPMNTEGEREKAIEAGAYNPQSPYKNMDKRFYHTIFYNDAPTVLKKTLVPQSRKNRINVWYRIEPNGSRLESDHIKQKGFQSYCSTGYLLKRLTGDMNWTNTASREMTDPLFLLSELYLNYAEAANEIGGPQGSVEGGPTSYEALMVIRNRAEQGDVRSEYLENKDVFRERIKNERCVELAFIGHYYYDSYRWLDAEKYRTQPMYGMDVEMLTGNYDKNKYPDGFRYTRVLIPDNRQTKVWNNDMYYMPFDMDKYYQFKNFDTSLNPYW